MKGFKKLAVCGMAVMLGLGSPVGNSVMNDLGYTVTAEAAGKVALSSSKASVAVGASKTISLRNASGSVKWSVAKKSVVSIKANGASVKVKGKKAGTTTITAKVGKKSYKCKLTVKNAPKISKSSISLTKGNSYDLSVTGTASSPKWSTSNKKVATIKKVSARKYRVTAKSSGTATIKAKVNGKTLKCKVSVPKSSSATQAAPVKYPSTSHSSANGKTLSSDKCLLPNGMFDPTKVKKKGNDYQVGNIVYGMNFCNDNVLDLNLRDQVDHDFGCCISIGVNSFGVSEPEYKKVLINPNDVVVTGYDSSLITVAVDDKSNKANAQKGYGEFTMRVYPSGRRGGTTYITTNYRGLIFKTKVAVHDDFKNTIPVNCKRCGFKCGDWYTENGYDVNKWMYYHFDRYPWLK